MIQKVLKPLNLLSLKGSLFSCGQEYGEIFRDEIVQFLEQETKPNFGRIVYAQQCLKEVQRFTPQTYTFMKGMNRGSGLSLEELTLIMLHEEIVHQEHCTGILARGSSTKKQQTILGQNWDWHPNKSSFAGLLELTLKERPRSIAYTYPGLWFSQGINKKGLGLVWTGAGYYPLVRPKVGIPTYALISEIFKFSDVTSVLKYLQEVKNAGCFIFLLSDKNKKGAVVEGIPGKLVISQTDEIYVRANHYEFAETVRSSRQNLHLSQVTDTKIRSLYAHNQLKKDYGQISTRTAQNLLSSNKLRYNFSDHMTIDSFVLIAEERALLNKRGGSDSKGWRIYTF